MARDEYRPYKEGAKLGASAGIGWGIGESLGSIKRRREIRDVNEILGAVGAKLKPANEEAAAVFNAMYPESVAKPKYTKIADNVLSIGGEEKGLGALEKMAMKYPEILPALKRTGKVALGATAAMTVAKLISRKLAENSYRENHPGYKEKE